jgi:DNA-directed RNA polymerase specialized sigma24 family protein
MREALLKVWERWDHVRTLDDPIGYLYRTAMNLHRKRLRRAAVRSGTRSGPGPRATLSTRWNPATRSFARWPP